MTQFSLCIYYNCILILVLRKKKNKFNEDGILLSNEPDEKVKLNDVNRSFYLEMMLLVNNNLKKNGDWLWVKDMLNGERVMGSEVESITKRYNSYACYIRIL